MFAVERLSVSPGSGEVLTFSKEPSISEILDGFQRLVRILEDTRLAADNYLRPLDSLPGFVGKTRLQNFPFLHTLPYLDLVPSAQVGLAEGLKGVASELNDSGIMTARNGLFHAKSTAPTIEVVAAAVKRARQALDKLESLGCVRRTFEHKTSLLNSAGRWAITLAAGPREIEFSSPSRFEWLGLPGMRVRQYLFHSAIFESPNEMLRFKEGFDSPYQEYWLDYVRRPAKGAGEAQVGRSTSGSPLESGSFVGAVVD